MKDREVFSYYYSAAKNKELQEIRKKYLSPEKNKMEELKKLDRYVQISGQLPSFALGIIGCLVFIFGLCLVMQVIGENILWGVFLEIIGVLGMIAAYPVFCAVSQKIKAKYAPRILKLSDELMKNKRI